jgi:hypothetical protein
VEGVALCLGFGVLTAIEPRDDEKKDTLFGQRELIACLDKLIRLDDGNIFTGCFRHYVSPVVSYSHNTLDLSHYRAGFLPLKRWISHTIALDLSHYFAKKYFKTNTYEA